MNRQDLRNRAPKFKGSDPSEPWPKKRRALKLSTVLNVLAVLVLLVLLWETSLSRLFPESSRGTDVHRYYVH